MAEDTTIKKKDFVELNYTGKLAGEEDIFDTTDEKLAEKAGIKSPGTHYGPIIVCIGEGQLLKGLDAKLQGQKLGKHVIKLEPEEGFGKKNPKLIQLTQTNKFKEHGIRPAPGMKINIDGMIGKIRTVSGGRTIVDFNHPLAGRELEYSVDVLRKVNDKKEQINSLMQLMLNVNDAKITITGKKAAVELSKKLPEESAKKLAEKIKDLIGVEISFKGPEEKKTEAKVDGKAEEKAKDKVIKAEVKPVETEIKKA